MIRPYGAELAVYLHAAPIDFRKQINGLAAIVQDELSLDPFSASVFVFSNRRRTAVKMLAWERNGFLLWHKKLETDRFHWPRPGEAGDVVSMSVHELNLLLDGIDLRYIKPHQTLSYQYAA